MSLSCCREKASQRCKIILKQELLQTKTWRGSRWFHPQLDQNPKGSSFDVEVVCRFSNKLKLYTLLYVGCLGNGQLLSDFIFGVVVFKLCHALTIFFVAHVLYWRFNQESLMSTKPRKSSNWQSPNRIETVHLLLGAWTHITVPSTLQLYLISYVAFKCM